MSKKLLLNKLQLLETYIFSEDQARSEWIDLSSYKDCDIIIVDYDLAFDSSEWFTYLFNDDERTLHFQGKQVESASDLLTIVRLGDKCNHSVIKPYPEQMLTSIKVGVYYPDRAKVLTGSTVKIYGGKFNL